MIVSIEFRGGTDNVSARIVSVENPFGRWTQVEGIEVGGQFDETDALKALAKAIDTRLENRHMLKLEWGQKA